MRRSAASLAAATVAVFWICGAGAAWAQPIAVAPEPAVDLGEIVKGDLVWHEFEIRNEGDAALLIESVRSSCGCTVADYDEVIAPGETGLIRALLNTRSLNGPVDTAIRVATSDPAQPEITLALDAKVRAFLGALPGEARWNTVETETEGTIGITLWALDKQLFEVSEVAVDYPDISGRVRPAAEDERFSGNDGPQWRVELTLGTDPPIGAIAGYAEIRTTHPKQKKVHVPVSGFVRPLIFVSPSQTDLGEFSLDAGPRRARYEVRNFGTAPMAIERVECSVEGVECSVDTLEAGYIYQVAVLFETDRVPAGAFAGQVVVHTDLVKRPTISWDIEGTVMHAGAAAGRGGG